MRAPQFLLLFATFILSGCGCNAFRQSSTQPNSYWRDTRWSERTLNCCAEKSTRTTSTYMLRDRMKMSAAKATDSIRTVKPRMSVTVRHRERMEALAARQSQKQIQANTGSVEKKKPEGIPKPLFSPGQELLTLGSEVAGFSFSIIFLLQGLLGLFMPRPVWILYGIDIKNMADDRKDTFIAQARDVGGFMFQVGLTSALALRSEIDLLGHLPSPRSMKQSIIISYLSGEMLKIWNQSLLKIILSGGCYLIFWRWLLKKEWAINVFLVGAHALSGTVQFFAPTLMIRSTKTDTEEEQDLSSQPEQILAMRFMGLTCITYALLLASLRSSVINVLPSIGLAALSWSIGHLYILLFAKEFQQCNCRVSAFFASIAVGAAVSAGGLRHYLVT